MNRLLGFCERLRVSLKKHKRERVEERSHYPCIWLTEPAGPVSEAPAPDAEFSMMLYTYYPLAGSVLYCPRDVLCEVLRVSLSEKRLEKEAEEMLERVESHSEGMLLFSELPPDGLVDSHPDHVLELADGHTYRGPTESIIEMILESRHPYRVHCLYCERTYESSSVLVEEWYHLGSGGRVFMCPEKHPLLMFTDIHISLPWYFQTGGF